MQLKTYDGVKDHSPLYCAGGAIVLVLMAGREFSNLGVVSVRLGLMLLVAAVFGGVALWLRRRHVLCIEVVEDEEGGQRLLLGKGAAADLVILKSELAYVKWEQDQVVIHYHRGEDLNRASFFTKGAHKKKVEQLVEYLKTWGE
ncbi:MAG: hypothetical protein L3J39_12165 [Verrucomicrobiales bacterium]|nr:hypothetical protein [Verrucomicrobiales bacterium]